jgi:uncharacterized repeat protein (TIGR01451 family)
MRRTGPARVAVGRDAEWVLRIRNDGDVPLNNVVIRERLPAELSFRGASNGGLYDSRSGDIAWSLGTIARGDEFSLRYTAAGVRPSTRAVQSAIATASPNFEQREESIIEVLGVPALRVEAMSDSNPVEAGRRINYTIRVTNQGTLAMDQIGVIADIPKEMRPLDAFGPRRGSIDGQVVTFPVIDSLPPGQTVTLTILTQAMTAGDTRFRVAVKAMSMPTPIITEEATRIIPPMRGPALP